MMRKTISVAALIGLFFGYSLAYAANPLDELIEYKKENPYKGGPLPGTAFVCTTDRVVSTGFIKKQSGDVYQAVSVEKPLFPWTGKWRIDLTAKLAFVKPADESLKNEPTSQFDVTHTEVGLILKSRRLDNESKVSSSDTITLDLSNSSFVYSYQEVDRHFNGVTVFYGSCLYQKPKE